MELMNIVELSEKVKHLEEALEKQVFVEAGHIVLKVNYKYPICLSRCDTPGKIVDWVSHLTQITWVTTGIINRFVTLACRENKIEIPNA